MTETSASAARKWLEAGAEFHAAGRWSESAAAARLGLGYAQLAAAEIALAALDHTQRARYYEGCEREQHTLPTRAELRAATPAFRAEA